jgi:hypothetical protein
MSYCQTFRSLAERAAEGAVADIENPNLGKHIARDGKIITHTPKAAEAVILSVTALEAGANEIATSWQTGFLGTLPPLPDGFFRMRLAEKWCLIPCTIAESAFQRGSSPWQDFRVLVALRDALVHFKWRSERVPGFMRFLQAKDMALPDTSPGIYWVDAALTDRSAVWACRTAEAMFAELARLVDAEHRPSWAWG